MDNEKELYIKNILKKDNLISKKADDVFKNFFKTDIHRIEVRKLQEESEENLKIELTFLGCVEEGYDKFIEEYINHDIIQYMIDILPKREQWVEVMCFNCGAAFAFAVKGGLPCERASSISIKYTNAANQVKNEQEFVELQKSMYIHFAEEVKYYKEIKSGNKIVDKAINYIEDHIDTRIRIEDISTACLYSKSRLQHLFNEHMNMSITDYIRKKKIEKACFLLSYTNLSCIQISEKLSYCSQSYFINQFYKEKEMNPLEYRQNNSINI